LIALKIGIPPLAVIIFDPLAVRKKTVVDGLLLALVGG
jgi:hypothetical protein